jgi:hypothetical protein
MEDPPFGLGKTFGTTSTSEGLNWEGCIKQFPDINPTTGAVRSNRIKTCVCVRNSSGSTLYKQRLAAFTSGSMTAVSGYARTTTGIWAGVTDEWLSSSGVEANDLFWVTIEGPTVLNTAQQVAVDDLLVATTAHTTNSTSSAGTGGYASTAGGSTGPRDQTIIGRVLGGTTGAVTALIRRIA